MFFNLLGIRARMTLGLSLIVLLAVASAGTTWLLNRTVKYQTAEVAASWIPAIENLGYMKDHLTQHFVEVSDASTQPLTQLSDAKKKIKSIEEQLTRETEVYAATLLTYQPDDPKADQEKALYADYQAKRNLYFKSASEMLTVLSDQATTAEIQELVRRQFAQDGPVAFRQSLAALDAILKFNLTGTADAARLAEERVRTSEWAQGAMLALMLVISLALIWFLPRSVIGPVNEAVVLAQRISDGDLTRPIRVVGQDELGHLLTNLQTMQTRLSSVVRALAGRSAEAAKEISALINESVSRVEQGNLLVDQAGNTMQEVVTSIQRVSDIVGEISAASQEQSQGVAQVGEAVTQMDRVTQQNAALVEQMAVATNHLRSQADDLVQTVATFKLA
ncbi:MAG: hypothetical protein OHK0048_19780 [Rhodoferax sp.]